MIQAPPRPADLIPDEALIKEARRRQRKRRLVIVALVMVLAIGGVIAWAVAGSPPAHRVPSGTSHPLGAQPAASPTTTTPQSPIVSQAYDTIVEPNSPLIFASHTVGWLATPAPETHSDPTILIGTSTGPPGQLTGTWQVDVTTDGGLEWHPTLRLSPYVWGMDATDIDHVWVVGVTALYASTDGGQAWTEMGEPAGTFLVRVVFTNSLDGFGLTTDGDLAATVNGGLTWNNVGQSWVTSASTWNKLPVDLCLQGTTLVMDDNGGDIFTSTTPTNPASWTKVLSSPIPVGGVGHVGVSILGCTDTGTAWEEVYTETQGPQGGIGLGWVAESTATGGVWTILPGSAFATIPTLPKAILEQGPRNQLVLSTAAPGPLFAVTANGPTVQLDQSTDGARFSAEHVAGLLDGVVPARTGGAAGPPNTIAGRGFDVPTVYGVSFDSPTDGWLDAGVLSQLDTNASAQRTIIYHTTDGGSTWHAVYQWATPIHPNEP